MALEELQPIADAARAAMATIGEAKTRGHVLARLLANVSTEAGPDAPGFYEYNTAFAAATNTMREAFDLPLPDENAERAFGMDVLRLLAALKTDASARLSEVA